LIVDNAVSPSIQSAGSAYTTADNSRFPIIVNGAKDDISLNNGVTGAYFESGFTVIGGAGFYTATIVIEEKWLFQAKFFCLLFFCLLSMCDGRW